MTIEFNQHLILSFLYWRLSPVVIIFVFANWNYLKTTISVLSFVLNHQRISCHQLFIKMEYYKNMSYSNFNVVVIIAHYFLFSFTRIKLLNVVFIRFLFSSFLFYFGI